MNARQAATIGDWVSYARLRLPRLEADVLSAHALAVPRSHLYAFQEQPVAQAVGAQVADWIERRVSGEPVAYILGQREFWGLDLEVTPAALIPRPDTETLVTATLEKTAPTARVLDLGTGCGAVALAIAKERPLARVLATDIDAKCAALCRRNAARLDIAVEIRVAALFEGVDGSFDVIASNPPYIDPDDDHLSRGDLRLEPQHALIGGPNGGLAVIERLIRAAPYHLLPGGWLCIEHGCEQEQCVYGLFEDAGFETIHCYLDIEKRPRVTVGQRSSECP